MDRQLELPANFKDEKSDEIIWTQDEMPTDEEMGYFDNYAEVIDCPDLVRTTSETMKMKPTRIRLRNTDRLPKGCTLDKHAGVVFDIFIRSKIKEAGGDLKETLYWLNLNHPEYLEKDGFWIIHKSYQMANGLTLINTVAAHNQSKPELGFDDTFLVTMRVFTREKKQGKGKGGRIPDQIMKKFGLKNKNVLGATHCLPKALVIGKAWSDSHNCEDPEQEKSLNKKYRILTRPDVGEGARAQHQQDQAEQLLVAVGLDPYEGEHTLEDLEQLADYLQAYRICIWTLHPGAPFPTIMREYNQTAEGCIPIFYVNEHYEFFVPSVERVKFRFCFKCNKLAKKNHWKKCEAICKRCGREECHPDGSCTVTCEKCSIKFYSKECYDAHLVPRSTRAKPYCERYEKCSTCGVIHKRPSYGHDEHVCFNNDYCNICRQKISGPHECSHAAPTLPKRKKHLKKQESWVMVVYDFESVVAKTGKYNGVEPLGPKHEPNMLCYRLMCHKCMGGYCRTCGKTEQISYKSEPGETGTVVERFCEFLRTDPRLKDAIVIAHNGGRYDHVFTLEHLTKTGDYCTNFIMSGSTIIKADLTSKENNNLHFRDSVRYMPMKLDQLPAAFELETKSKGFFPYLYNHPDNYEDPLTHLPDIEYYEPRLMSVKNRAVFEEWYEENKDTSFELHQQLVDYCRNDVQILVEALAKYIRICQETFNGWHPIIQAPTLAAYVLHVMKYEHIKTGDVGLIPENGYVGRNNSEFALKYLLWLEHKDPDLKLKHQLRRGGEHFLVTNNSGRCVDGFNTETNEVYEIHGCLWHGCDKCYLHRDAYNPRDKNRTIQELFDETKSKDDDIRNSGFNLHVRWECEIKEELKKDPEMAEFFKNCHHAHQLRPREAMYGGRTQQFKSLVEACSEFSVEYHDFCSLYPYINIKGTEYPRGTPFRITEDFEPITEGPIPYRGLVFCDLLPPSDCPIPVIPKRENGKLLFILCRSCGSSKRPSECTHTKVSERYLTGVWCTDELNVAIEEGYKILKYHEVWHWEPELWFRGGFFESFMAPLLKMKHEASGWPRNDMTDEEQQTHVSLIHENDGVQLDIANIKKNPAFRNLSKLFLNSTWGKFAQNPCKTETKLFEVGKALQAVWFISAPGYEPKSFEEWGDSHILVSRKPVKEAAETTPYTNIVFGVLTTAAARIKLFQAMKQVGAENLIYCDTDSVIFKQRRGEDVLGSLRGDALGQLTNETPSGFEIKEIVAMAPKVYALKMVDGQGNEKCVTKAKGITLNSETAQKVNFESMKAIMQKQLKGEPEHFEVRRMRMKRGAHFLDGLQTVMEKKILRSVMDKGIFDENGELIPFGTKKMDEPMEEDYEFQNEQ